MFQKMSLQNRLLGSFGVMGAIVLVVGAVGWSGSNELSKHITVLGKTVVPSVSGLWKVNEGQTQIQSAERALLNPLLTQDNRLLELERIKEAWKQIDEGFEEYDSTVLTEEEKKIYADAKLSWNAWKENHEKFLTEYQEFARYNMPDPTSRMLDLTNQGRQNSPEMAMARAADVKLDRLSLMSATEELKTFQEASNYLTELTEYNQDVGEKSQISAANDASRTTALVLAGMILGPGAAMGLGVFLSNSIAKPLGAKIAGIVNSIVSSSSEIAATVEQQERTAAHQASSVSETTTTMDELNASSRTSSEQAEAAAAETSKILALVAGAGNNDQSQFSGSSLTEKVRQIAEQILSLSEQTHQIGSISTLVSELANQTNMLALNAAVEAVRAGEHGKGFSVVASEIRKLADESKKSAERINSLVVDIQKATNSTVMVTDEGRKTVDNVVSAVNSIAMNTQQISLTAKQQAVAIRQVVEAMNTLNQGASETASGISQTKVGTQKLSEAALALQAVV